MGRPPHCDMGRRDRSLPTKNGLHRFRVALWACGVLAVAFGGARLYARQFAYTKQYAYRRDRSTLDAVSRVHKLLYAGHQEIVDADLSSYFDGIPHAGLLQSVARRPPSLRRR